MDFERNKVERFASRAAEILGRMRAEIEFSAPGNLCPHCHGSGEHAFGCEWGNLLDDAAFFLAGGKAIPFHFTSHEDQSRQ